MTVGLIGLGNAGTALAAALGRNADIVVFDRDAARMAGLDGPGEAASDTAEVARRCDLILLSLPTPEASLAVARELAPEITPGTIVVETSTVGPDTVEALHNLLSPRGAQMLDAAIVGGVAKLAAGEGVFLVGAEEAASGRAGELLRASCEEIHFLGARGAGMRMKLVVNAVAHGALALVVEAGALAAAQGLPLDVYEQLIERPSGLMRPFRHRFVDRLRNRDFAGGMSVANTAKDSTLALEIAGGLDVAMPITEAAHRIYEKALAAGLAGLDYAAIGQLWERELGIAFQREDAGDY